MQIKAKAKTHTNSVNLIIGLENDGTPIDVPDRNKYEHISMSHRRRPHDNVAIIRAIDIV